MPVFTRRKMNGRHARWGCSGSRSRIVPPTARPDASTKRNAGSARGRNGGRGARAESACSNDGTGSTAAAIGERKGWNGGSDSGWSQTRSSIWEEFWQAGGTDKAVRRLRGKKLPSGYGKSPGSTNAHSGKAPDLSGPTLAPLETSFLRRKVARLPRNTVRDVQKGAL